MKEATKQKIESILTDELNGYVNPYEITNTISKMDNGFDSGSNINKNKLKQIRYEHRQVFRQHHINK